MKSNSQKRSYSRHKPNKNQELILSTKPFTLHAAFAPCFPAVKREIHTENRFPSPCIPLASFPRIKGSQQCYNLDCIPPWAVVAGGVVAAAAAAVAAAVTAAAAAAVAVTAVAAAVTAAAAAAAAAAVAVTAVTAAVAVAVTIMLRPAAVVVAGSPPLAADYARGPSC